MTRAISIDATPADLDRLRGNPMLADVLTLCRIANMMRSVLSLAIDHADQSTSAAQRGRMSATLLLAGMMAEALPALERAGATCRHLVGYKTRAIPLLKDPQRADTHREWMSPLRNKAVFHHDRDVSATGLQQLRPAVPQAMVTGSSTNLLDVYYPLADIAAFTYMIQSSAAADRPVEFLSGALETVTNYTIRICEAIDAIVGDAVVELKIGS